VSQIYWDTMLFVYLLEGHAQYAKRIQEISTRMDSRGDTVCTSVLTAGEVLSGPVKAGDAKMATEILNEFRSPRIDLLDFTLDTAQRYAEIRALNRVSPADAIHLATAAQAKVDLFLTNDRRLSHLVIPGIDFIAGLDVNLF